MIEPTEQDPMDFYAGCILGPREQEFNFNEALQRAHQRFYQLMEHISRNPKPPMTLLVVQPPEPTTAPLDLGPSLEERRLLAKKQWDYGGF